MPNILEAFVGEKALKTTALSTAIKLYTGENPVVEKHDTHTDIKFTPTQVAKLQNVMGQWMDQKPGTVRLNVGPVLLPFYLKRYWYYVAGAVAVGAVLGAVIKR